MKNLARIILKNMAIIAVFTICTYGFTEIPPIVTKGYDMYRNAVNLESISDKIENLKQDDSYVTIDEISEEFKKQILQSEDSRFYHHFGIDPIATVRASVHNIQAGSFVQGGSTITQQLAKNLYFSFEKKLERKVAEVFVVFELEHLLTKDEILELYCNVVYYGEGCYGLQEATEHYYNISPDELSEEQASALVFTIKSPNYYNPNVYENAAA
ncbi:penicillin-binding protein 1A [Anaerotignum neopropionicum]|uniref:Penicillin-binding protein 1A n=1 Tax=Anaerotignum neopropionicum TaxID=36847 RepID=A0A136WD56_9FIRM|nr:biosynthetic peptidoglycan transglycosylase [Anaerotignum neopropionicum]KXL52431.1 penicillin-binding protein 1A [Anaerotignum neopropionicum]